MRCLAMAEYMQKRQREETFRHDVSELGTSMYDPRVRKRKREGERKQRKNERKRERQEQKRQDAIEHHACSNILEKAMKDAASNALLGDMATQNRLLDELHGLPISSTIPYTLTLRKKPSQILFLVYTR